ACPARAVELTGVGVKRAARGTVEALKARSASVSALQDFRLRQVMPAPGLPAGRESGYQYEAYGGAASAAARGAAAAAAAAAGRAGVRAAAVPASSTVRLVGFTSGCL